MMMPSKIKSLLEGAEKIGILVHFDGDADAFCSMIGLARTLKHMGKQTVLFGNEKVSSDIEYLSAKLDFDTTPVYEKIDLLVCLDFNDKERAMLPEIITKAREDGAKIITIDHHAPGTMANFSDIYWSEPTSSSTAELVFALIKEVGIIPDRLTATLLLTGIEVDTGSFSYTNTSTKTFEAVSELLKRGVNIKEVTENAFGRKPLLTVKFLGLVLDRLYLNKKYGIAITYVTKEDIEEYGLSEKLTSGVANFLDRIREARVIMVLTERAPGIIKVSVRSNNSGANVGRLCQFFGGGGHIKAAGFTFKGDIRGIFDPDSSKNLTPTP